MQESEYIRKGEYKMIIYLPCKLGEQFSPLKFKDWVNGERVYEEAPQRVLQSFSKSLFNPSIFAEGAIYSYDPTGKSGKGYNPKYKVSVDFGKTAKLCEMGFPGSRTVQLYGIRLSEGIIMAEFVTTDRHEHIYYPIKDTLQYSGLDEEPVESTIEYLVIEKIKENRQEE